ncbi:hypothetical protein I7I48_01591 [Histoplasma ohiense]|nr:hypothetical protein I7I48_01591 [Histoplasma ohiense (nom. inval.)]
MAREQTVFFNSRSTVNRVQANKICMLARPFALALRSHPATRMISPSSLLCVRILIRDDVRVLDCPT